jgi:hypothetical protein
MMVKLIEILCPQRVDTNFDQCYKILNQKGMLQIQKVITKEGDIILKPFIDSNPPWWQAYNSHTKHRLPEGLEKATLENLLNIHACLFILHSIATLRHYVWGGMKEDRGVFLDKDNWIDLEDDLSKGKSRICWKMSKLGTSGLEARTDFREVMRESSLITSDVFDYVTVVKLTLIANVIQGSDRYSNN